MRAWQDRDGAKKKKKGRKCEYSFYSPPHNVYTGIDYFLISEALANNSVNSSIGNIVISEHVPIFPISLKYFGDTSKLQVAFKCGLN